VSFVSQTVDAVLKVFLCGSCKNPFLPMYKAILLVHVLVLAAISLRCQEYELSGKVVDSRDNTPLANVNVIVAGLPKGTITNEAGFFSLRIYQIPAQLYFSHIGYAVVSVIVDEKNRIGILISLEPEVQQIDEVTVMASPIRKIRLGDTLNVIDYDFVGENRMVLVASPYKNSIEKYLFLADGDGRQINKLMVKQIGKQIKFPEQLTPEQVYLFKSFDGSCLLLNHHDVKEVAIEGDSILLHEYSDIPEFLSLVLPIKTRLGDRLFFQWSTKINNWTFMTVPSGNHPMMVKEVYDPYGNERYVKPPGAPGYIKKHVSAPCFSLSENVLVFDFFENHIDFIDAEGQSIRQVPINFHLIDKRIALLFTAKELNQREFKQIIIQDEVTHKFYALFQPVGKKFFLEEIDVETGNMINKIELPEFPNVVKVKVHDGKLFFLYQVKQFPAYVSLYKMDL